MLVHFKTLYVWAGSDWIPSCHERDHLGSPQGANLSFGQKIYVANFLVLIFIYLLISLLRFFLFTFSVMSVFVCKEYVPRLCFYQVW
jgi:hypothetical protein